MTDASLNYSIYCHPYSPTGDDSNGIHGKQVTGCVSKGMLHLFAMVAMAIVVCVCVQKNDDLLGPKRLVVMSKGVAAGMQYFGEIGFVHRVSMLAW